jgi:hypothetical protein
MEKKSKIHKKGTMKGIIKSGKDKGYLPDQLKDILPAGRKIMDKSKKK